jgi:hypothetical protein
MDFISAYEIMKKGGSVFKKQNPDIIYTAKFEDVSKKYTIFENGKELGNDTDWYSIFSCNDWEVVNNDF